MKRARNINVSIPKICGIVFYFNKTLNRVNLNQYGYTSTVNDYI